MASPVEVVPSDRLVFMVGQPIIRLFASGGPGGDLGDWNEYEAARPGRSGLYPKKVSDTVSYDDTLGCCGNAFSLADLACCGADERNRGMGQATPEAAAQNAVDQCKGIDERISKILEAAKAADAKEPAKAKALKQQVKALRKTFRGCLRRLNSIVKGREERLKASGMGQVVNYAEKKSDLEACRDKVTQLQQRVDGQQKRWTDHMKKFHGK